VEILKRSREDVRRKRPEIWPNDCIFHNDDAPAHRALSSSCWPKSRLVKWNTHPIPLICLRMTWGAFQK
jgi:hypothetical protein